MTTSRGYDRQDVLTRLRITARSARAMAKKEPHLAGFWDTIAGALDTAEAEIVRLRDLAGEPRPGRGLAAVAAYKRRQAALTTTG